MNRRTTMNAIAIVAVAAFAVIGRPVAAASAFKGDGPIYAAEEFYEGSGRVGCLVYLTLDPDVRPPLLKRDPAPTSTPCTTLFPIGAQIAVIGRHGREYIEITQVFWPSRPKKESTAAAPLDLDNYVRQRGTVIGTARIFDVGAPAPVPVIGCRVSLIVGYRQFEVYFYFADSGPNELCSPGVLKPGSEAIVEGWLDNQFCVADRCANQLTLRGRELSIPLRARPRR